MVLLGGIKTTSFLLGDAEPTQIMCQEFSCGHYITITIQKENQKHSSLFID